MVSHLASILSKHLLRMMDIIITNQLGMMIQIEISLLAMAG